MQLQLKIYFLIDGFLFVIDNNKSEISFGAFEVKTFKYKDGLISETSMI